MSALLTSTVNAAVSDQALALLRRSGAMQRPHSGRTLYDHLTGTYALLQGWGNPDHVCLGGLFHSIYGTNAFRHQSLTPAQRPELQAAIGVEAERLAWHFCNIDRPWAILAGLRRQRDASSARTPARLAPESLPELDLSEWWALAEIECANLVEQGDRGRGLRDLYCVGLEQSGSLSAAALAALRQCLASQLSRSQINSVLKAVEP